MVKLVLNNIIPEIRPKYGWMIGYRIKDSTSDYIELRNIKTQPIIIETSDPDGTLYEGYIKSECEPGEFTDILYWTINCQCQDNYYIINSDSVTCVFQEQIEATKTYDSSYILNNKCPDGWDLDISLGVDNAVCKRTLNQKCNDNCYVIKSFKINNISFNTLRVYWLAGTGDYNNYILEYKKDSDTTWQQIIVDKSEESDEQTYQKEITGLESGVKYNIRIVTNCISGSTIISQEISEYTLTTACPKIKNFGVYQENNQLFINYIHFIGTDPLKYIINYRKVGETDYQIAETNQTPLQIKIDNTSLYEGFIQIVCNDNTISDTVYWKNTCKCPSGYTLELNDCIKEKTSNIENIDQKFIGCYRQSVSATTPTLFGTYIKFLNSGDYQYLNTDFWGTAYNNRPESLTPLSSSLLWLDKNCTGTINGDIPNDTQFFLKYTYNNEESFAKRMFVLTNGGPTKILKVNNVTYNLNTAYSSTSNRLLLIEVLINPGLNNITLIHGNETYDGYQHTKDVGFVLLDNTYQELYNSTIDLPTLNPVFSTSQLIGTIANNNICAEGWELTKIDDIFICVQKDIIKCNVYPEICKEVTNINFIEIDYDRISLKWDTLDNVLGYLVEYKIIDSSIQNEDTTVKSVNVTDSNVILKGLVPKCLYEIKVTTICQNTTITSKSIRVSTRPLVLNCDTGTHYTSVNSELFYEKVYDLGCVERKINIVYDIKEIDLKDKAQIDIYQNNKVIKTVPNLSLGDSGVLVMNFKPTENNCTITLKTQIIQPQVTEYRGFSVGSDLINESCKLDNNTSYYSIATEDSKELKKSQVIYVDKFLNIVLRGENKWFKITSENKNYNIKVDNNGFIIDIIPCNPKNLTIINNSTGLRSNDTVEKVEINGIEVNTYIYGSIPLTTGNELYTYIQTGYNTIKLYIKSSVISTDIKDSAKIQMNVNYVKQYEQKFDTNNDIYIFTLYTPKILNKDEISIILN